MHSHLSFLLHSYCCSPQKSRSRLVRSPHQINRACCLYDTYSTYPMITISLQEGKASGCRDKLGCHIKRAANTWITLCDGWLEGKHNDDSHITVPLTPNPSSLRAARHMGKQSRSDWEAPCGRTHWVYICLVRETGKEKRVVMPSGFPPCCLFVWTFITITPQGRVSTHLESEKKMD